MAAQPKSYTLAQTKRSALVRRYTKVVASLVGDGVKSRLKTFESMLKNGCPAINMTLPGCIRFLESGHWLNVHEVVALNVKASQGPDFDRELQRILGPWYKPRIDFERLLEFRRDTHYSALNLGGAGPDYGECCVRFGSSAPLEFSTIFAGDPLRVAFDDDGNRILSDDDVLARFAIYCDRAALAAVANPAFLDSMPIIDRDSLIRMLDDRETLIEVHLHGSVRREHATEIAIQRDFFLSVGRRCLEYEEASRHEREAKKFSKVRAFKRLLQLTDWYGLKLLGETKS